MVFFISKIVFSVNMINPLPHIQLYSMNNLILDVNTTFFQFLEFWQKLDYLME